MTVREETDVLVVGAGPAGSATAAWLARLGVDVLLTDAAVFPRDKTCGDGLTPRAIGELERLGLGDWLRAHTVNHGLRAHGFGQTLLLPWPGGTLPDWGSAVARTELDDHLRTTAIKSGARALDGVRGPVEGHPRGTRGASRRTHGGRPRSTDPPPRTGVRPRRRSRRVRRRLDGRPVRRRHGVLAPRPTRGLLRRHPRRDLGVSREPSRVAADSGRPAAA